MRLYAKHKHTEVLIYFPICFRATLKDKTHFSPQLFFGEKPMPAAEFLKLMRQKRAIVELDSKLASRSVNEGFSGGEKKRNEIFQMAVLEPKLSILDETDSGLDIDALRVVAGGVNKLRTEQNATILSFSWPSGPSAGSSA